MRRQILVCAGGTRSGDGARTFSLYTVLVTDGEIEAQGRRRRWEPWLPLKGAEGRAGVCLCLQELTPGWEGRVWLLGWGTGQGGGKVLLPSPAAGCMANSRPGMSVGSQETHLGPAAQEGRDREDGATPKRQPESGSSSVFSCSHGDGEVGATRQRVASVGEGWVRFPRPPYQRLCPRDS